MLTIRRQILALCTSLLFSPVLWADDTRWYQVEVILFGQNSETFRDAELWPVDYRLPDQLNAIDLRSPGKDENNRPQAFSMVEEASLQLGPEAERILKNEDLSLLLHLGWYQPGLATEQAKGIRIQAHNADAEVTTATPATEAQSQDPPTLEGVLTLSLSRYLHMNVDVLYRAALPMEEIGSGEMTQDTQQMPVDLFQFSEQATWFPESRWQIYRLTESRRMRSNELHYLDHPVIGMLVLVTPL